MQPLEQLQKRLKGLIIKRPGMALGLWGEAGIGKTHAAKQLLQESNCKTLSLHANVTLANLARALPKPKKLPVWAERILEKLECNEALSLEQTTSAFGVLFSGIAPFILYLEDVHEASVERLEWIQALAQTVKRLKAVALIVTSRSEPSEPFEAVRLEKLDFGAVKTLLETEARASLPTEALEWIHGKAAGNPLFTLEFFRLLTRQGFFWNDGERWRWRVPGQDLMPVTVEVLLEQALKETTGTPELEAILGAKAVLGLDCSGELWAEVAGLELRVFNDIRIKLEQNGVLLNNEFAHPLFRELTLKQLSKQQHAELARKAIQAFEDDPEKACQFIEVANLEPRDARELLSKAILRAEQAGQEVRAMRLLGRKVMLVPSCEREELILKAAQVLQLVDVSTTTQLLEMIPADTLPSQKFMVFVAEFWAQRGNLERALKTIEQLPPENKSELEWFGHLVCLHARAGDNAKAVEQWKAHPELELVCDLKTVTQVCNALTMIGQHPETERLVRQTLERPEIEIEQTYPLKNALAAALAYQGKTQAALEIWDQLIQSWSDERFALQRVSVMVNSAQIRLRLGQLQMAHDLLIQGRQTGLEVGDFRIVIQAQVILGDVLTKQAKYEQAEEKLLEAYSLLRDKPTNQLANVALALSSLYLYWFTPQSGFLAHRYARLALSTAQTLHNPMLTLSALCLLVQTEISINDLGAAREHANQALEHARQLQHPFLRVAALNAGGLVFEAFEQHQEALTSFREALSVAEEFRMHDTIQQLKFEIARMTQDRKTLQEIRVWNLEHGLQNEVDAMDRSCAGLMGLTETPQKITVNGLMPHLELLGTLQIVFENNPQPIRGNKRQELLALLLEARIAGRDEINRLELVDSLYPNEPEDRASSSLKQLIHGLRSSFHAEIIKTTTNGYALGDIKSDAEEFLSTNNSTLWRGTYLDGIIPEHGFESVRESLSLGLFNAATSQLQTNPKEAARASRILLQMNPYDFEILRLSVQAFKASENYKTLGRIYTDARARFSDVGETLPERWQDFLETSIPA